MAIKPRHPLFNRLARPLTPIYPDAVTPVAWDDEQFLEEAEGVVYLVSRPCEQMRTWAKQLKAQHRRDKTYETQEGISRLSLSPLRLAEMRTIGAADIDVYAADGTRVEVARLGDRLYRSVKLMAVVLDKADGRAVGFVSFGMRWAISADDEGDDEVTLDIEPDQAWIAPKFRGRRWGELAAIAIAMTARKHIKQVQASTRWPKGVTVPLKITVGADIYSTSGEAFLRLCAQYVDMQLDFDFWRELRRIQVVDVEFYPRW